MKAPLSTLTEARVRRIPQLARVVAFGCVLGVSAGCSPTGPTGSSEGVTIYEHPNYGGAARRFATDVRDLDDVRGPCSDQGWWDDCISSIRVPPGWSAIIYEDPNYRGGSLTVTADIPDLEHVMGPCGDDWENCISSIRVVRP